MTVLIDNRTDFHFTTKHEEIIQNIVGTSLKYEKFPEECEISISIVGNREIREINKQFRNIDKATDVLSFPQLTYEEGEMISRNENGDIILGDIIISIEKALGQAQEYGHSFEREIAFLTSHSMLHLLGYDHMSEDEEKEMFGKQKGILIEAGIPRDFKV